MEDNTIPQGMKPFNLERALSGDPVVMRNGEKVIAIYYLKEAESEQKIIAIREDGRYAFLFDGGKYYTESQSNLDLFMAAQEVTIWKNVYGVSNSDYWIGETDFKSEKDAINYANNGSAYIKTIPVTFTV